MHKKWLEQQSILHLRQVAIQMVKRSSLTVDTAQSTQRFISYSVICTVIINALFVLAYPVRLLILMASRHLSVNPNYAAVPTTSRVAVQRRQPQHGQNTPPTFQQQPPRPSGSRLSVQGRGETARGVATGAIGLGYGPYSVRLLVTIIHPPC